MENKASTIVIINIIILILYLKFGSMAFWVPAVVGFSLVESFFGFLKREHVFHNRYLTRAQARQSIFDYIERFYNRKRIHSSLGYKTPSEVDQLKLAA